MPYKLSDQEFREALREAVIENASRADGPYQGKLPEGFVPFYPLWWSDFNDMAINRGRTLLLGPYGFLTEEQKARLLEEA